MPTTRPRHVITETDRVAQALDDAAKRWPTERSSRGRLLLRLVEEGHRAITRDHKQFVAQRRDAIERASGSLPGVYGRDYLEDLREDWPA